MNWTEAVEAMKKGAKVNRTSQMTRTLIDPGSDTDGLGCVPIYDCGTEDVMLAHAWTDDEKPVLVFSGYPSRYLYVPESDDRNATDWVIV